MNLLGHTEINAVGAALCGGPCWIWPEAGERGRPRSVWTGKIVYRMFGEMVYSFMIK